MKRTRVVILAIGALLAFSAVSAAQGRAEVLHTFTGHAEPGIASSLVEGRDGDFYGTTYRGGTFDGGTFFRMTPDGNVTPLRSFERRGGGLGSPRIRFQATDGLFYGVEYSSPFKIDPQGNLTAIPQDALLQGIDGNFYGIDSSYPVWSVTRMTPDGTVTVVRSFHWFTEGALTTHFVQGTDGNFYGVAASVGSSHSDTLYKLTPSGSLTLLHEFTGEGGFGVYSLVRGSDGHLYGTSSGSPTSSLGRVWRVTTDGVLTPLYTFTGGVDGERGVLVAAGEGEVFGRTDFGGAFGRGTLFSVTSAGTFTTLHATDSQSGGGPLIRAANGSLYGGRCCGEYVSGDTLGILYRFDRDGTFTTLWRFSGGPEGAFPSLPLVEAVDGSFYGATGSGGVFDRGTIFRLGSDGGFETLHHFTGGEDGAYPGPLIQGGDGNLYGMTRGVPSEGCRQYSDCGGTFFRLTPAGALTTLHVFATATEGAFPGSLIQAPNGYFYGTMSSGGEFRQGTAFRISGAGTISVLHAFSWSDGISPRSLILGRDGNFYGTATTGGTADGSSRGGTVFRMTRDGSVTVLHRFRESDGVGFYVANLIEANDGNFYGATICDGSVFRMTRSGSVTTIGRHEGRCGYDDIGSSVSLAKGRNGTPYLTVDRTISKVSEGRLTRLYRLPSGAVGGVTEGRDGRLYGTNIFGGPSRAGTVFRLRVEPASLMTIDSPRPGTAVAQPFVLSGWAFDRDAPTGSGLTTIHVWAYPANGGAPIFVGAASVGLPRPDVAAAFGSEFALSGFRLDVRSLVPGQYTLIAYGLSEVTGLFDVERQLKVKVGTLSPIVRVAIDAPAARALVGASLLVIGWAIDAGSTDDAGVDAVHVYAYPASGGAPTFLGVAAVGVSRPDVAARWGPQFANAGYSLSAGGLAPGAYRLAVYAHSTITGTFTAQVRDITIRPPGDPHMAIDGPTPRTTVRVPFVVGGWAIDRDAPMDAGVDAIDIWAFPASGAAVFLGSTTSRESRPDVGATFGPQFTSSGYSLRVGDLRAGRYQIIVYAHSAVTGTFSQARVVTVTVR